MVKTSCIALQCPLTGGDAVFEARALLQLEIEDASVCNSGEATDRVDQKRETLALAPNPASQYISLPGQLNKSYKITNQFGQLISEGIITDGFLNTSKYPSGLYFITLFDENTRATTQSFVIINE
jgi:Secretion system C-terminal sorting domain